MEPSLLYAVKQVELAVRAHLDEVVRAAGLTTSTYTALTVLDRRTGLTTAELARNSFVTPQAMADIVTALERRALISRHADPDHGRRRLISLTGNGRAVLAELAPAVAALEEHMLAGLDADARVALRRSLSACRSALSRA
jgi:DNA-binding MarR family transcriptional regulator